jgi:hypothetical protein
MSMILAESSPAAGLAQLGPSRCSAWACQLAALSIAGGDEKAATDCQLARWSPREEPSTCATRQLEECAYAFPRSRICSMFVESELMLDGTN